MLTQARLKELLHYNPDTGMFTWVNIPVPCRVKNGDIAGNSCAGQYGKIKINYVIYSSHRLAFLYMEGYFPEFFVDHKNGITNDNRWSNLRHVTQSCNMQNQKINPRNTSGFTGVVHVERNNKWRASIMVAGRYISLGTHIDIISAALARVTFENQCGEWTCDHQAIDRVKLRELGLNV